MPIPQQRLFSMGGWMYRNDVDMVVISDTESRRDSALRYFSGHPADALLFLHKDAGTLLVPWDIALARTYAAAGLVQAGAILPYTDFKLEPIAACAAALEHFNLKAGAKIEIPDTTPYPRVRIFLDSFPDYTILCREKDGAGEFIRSLRRVKDSCELRLLQEAAHRTDDLMRAIERGVADSLLKTEADVALFIEAECRARGCEGTSFATLAAGTSRSFGIHAFPGYTAGEFAGRGLSLLDFGVVYEGYASDVTMTFARGPLAAGQERFLALVMEAYELVMAILNSEERRDEDGGLSVRAVAQAVDDFFSKHGLAMPHGLGHGIGLQVHEEPYLRVRASEDIRLLPGMVFTVEPGLYAPEIGGCRFENDIVLTESGALALTHSAIVRL